MRSFVFAVFATAVVVACSSSTGSSTADGCQSYASALCSKLDACAHFGVAVQYGDVATCTTRVARGCSLGVNAPGTGVTSAQLGACASALDGASCDDLLGHKPPSACATPAGTLADGAACAEDAQCKNRRCNRSGADCGACTKKSAAGEPCKDDGDCDDNGLVCNGATCVTPGAAGASCDGSHPCASTLFCKAGACAKPGAAGAPCDGNTIGECDAIAGVYCNPSSKVCAQVTLATAGQACATAPTFAACSGGGYCVGSTGSRTCLAPAADGAACDNLKGPHCLAPASCNDGVCTIEDPSACK